MPSFNIWHLLVWIVVIAGLAAAMEKYLGDDPMTVDAEQICVGMVVLFCSILAHAMVW